jgi:SnoaL-like domain
MTGWQLTHLWEVHREQIHNTRRNLPGYLGDMTMDSRIDPRHVQDILELQRLKALYFYYLDHKQWDDWCSLFTDDAKLIVDTGTTQDVTEGIKKVIVYVKERLAVIPSVHHGHMPLFEFVSNTEASGIWAMADIIYYSAEDVLFGYGHYRERYRNEDGIWKFCSVHLTRLKVDMVKRT